MRNCFVVLILNFVFFLASSQETINPFDILERQPERIQLRVETPVDTTIEQNMIENAQAGKEKKANNEFNNPFEVSHIPLRRSQVKKNNNIQSQKLVEQQKSGTYYLPMIIVLLSCIILGFVLARDRPIIGGLYRALNNKNFSNTYRRENKNGTSFTLLLTYLLFFLNAGLFIFQILSKISPNPQLGFAFIVLIIAGIYIGRHFIMMVFSLLFPVEEIIRPYNFTIQVSNTILGLVLIPLNLLVAYGPQLLITPILYFVAFLFLLLLGLRYLRGFSLSNRVRRDSLFHFFLYFCTFEIIPFVLGYSMIDRFVY